jgi:transcriptional regulator with XRE-family HTH domain
MKLVAQRAGKNQQWLSDRLHGRSPIYADDVYLLAKGLQCDPCDFYAPEAAPVPIPSREDREKTTDDDALLDLDAERLYRRYRRVFEEHAEELQSFMDYLDWKRGQQG